MWYINGVKIKLDVRKNSAYKLTLGLPKNSSNKVCWTFSNQFSLRQNYKML